MGDWLGIGTIAEKERKFRRFQDARDFVQSLKIRSQKEWADYCKSHKLPHDIPTDPRRVYKKDWKGWGIGWVLGI